MACSRSTFGSKYLRCTGSSIPSSVRQSSLGWQCGLHWDGSKLSRSGPLLTGQRPKLEGCEKYVRNCAWARDAELKIDATQILCESYKNKQGNQRFFQDNPLQLVSGTNYFQKQTKLFDQVVGFAKFSEYLIVAEVSYSQLSIYCYFLLIEIL